ncbi:pilus assembly protein PilM [Pseudomonas sp. RAC1]|nr:pilus assembly protein PilM [Pseudomonas sp. RAC1]
MGSTGNGMPVIKKGIAMLGRFGRDGGSVLGVQITSDSVRMLQLSGARGRRRVSSWVHQVVAPVTRLDADGESLAQALREAARRCGRARRVALAMPGSQVICKVVQLPSAVPEAEREARLLADAEHLFPFPLDDLAMDFQVLGPTAQASQSLDVLIGAARQSLVETLLLPFEDAGLEVVAVEVDSVALARLQPGADRQPLLLLEADGLALHTWGDAPLGVRVEQRFDNGCTQAAYLQRIEDLLASAALGKSAAGLMVGGAAATSNWLQVLEQHLGRVCQPICSAYVRKDMPAADHGAMALPLALALGADA